MRACELKFKPFIAGDVCVHLSCCVDACGTEPMCLGYCVSERERDREIMLEAK